MPDYAIQIERKTEDADPWIDSAEVWEVIAEPYAKIEPLTGRELIEAEQTTANHTHKLKFRWGPSLADLKTSDRVKFRGKTWNLTSVVNVGERCEWYECMAVEHGTDD